MRRRTATIYYGGFAFRGGGAFAHARMLARQLSKAGWIVRTVTLESLPLPFRYLPHVAEKIVNFFAAPLGFHVKGRVIRFFYRHLLSRGDDLRLFEDVYFTWNSAVPSVTALHALWSDNLQAFDITSQRVGRLVRAEEEAIDAIDHPVFTVSQQYKDHVLRTHARSTMLPRVAVIPLGLELEKFGVSLDAKSVPYSLIYCGSLEPRKNLPFLLDVLAALLKRDNRYRLTIVGDGPDRAALDVIVDERRFPVNLVGRLDAEAVISELRQHEIYVHPSSQETFSLALLEAKLCGLVTVAYAGLDVPTQFIDVPVAAFVAEDWADAIERARRVTPGPIDTDYYAARRMMVDTLELAGLSGGQGCGV